MASFKKKKERRLFFLKWKFVGFFKGGSTFSTQLSEFNLNKLKRNSTATAEHTFTLAGIKENATLAS